MSSTVSYDTNYYDHLIHPTPLNLDHRYDSTVTPMEFYARAARTILLSLGHGDEYHTDREWIRILRNTYAQYRWNELSSRLLIRIDEVAGTLDRFWRATNWLPLELPPPPPLEFPMSDEEPDARPATRETHSQPARVFANVAQTHVRANVAHAPARANVAPVPPRAPAPTIARTPPPPRPKGPRAHAPVPSVARAPAPPPVRTSVPP